MNWRKLLIAKIILLSVFLVAWSWFADAAKIEYVSEAEPKLVVATAVTPSLTAKAFLVVDLESGLVIATKEADKTLPIASVTKLFTAETILGSYDPSASATVSYEDVWSPEPFGKLMPGEEYTYRELVFPLLLESSNDAAAVFERETNNLLVPEMNKLASNIGLTETKFADASGLSGRNLSTASDLNKYLKHLSEEESHILDITRLPRYVGPYTGLVNNSPVFGADFHGGKHGYTEEAGRTLAAIFSVPVGKVERTFSFVILGSKDIAGDTKALKQFVQTNVRFE